MSTIPTGTPAAKNQSSDTGQTTAPQRTGNPGNVPAIALVQNAQDMPSHAQVLTVTTLPSNATVRLKMPWEISALAPPRPNRPESLIFGPMTSRQSGARVEYSFTVQGVTANSPFTGAIVRCFKHQAKGGVVCDFSHFRAKSRKDGSVEISFRANDFSFLGSYVDKLYLEVGNLFCNLHDLGVSEHDVKLFYRDDYIFAYLSKADWHCELTGDAIRQRGQFVRLFLITGHFDLAFRLICDLAEVCYKTGLHHVLESRSQEILPPIALSLILETFPITSKEFTDLTYKTLEQNPQFLKHRHCLVQAGRMLLRSILDPHFQSSFHNSIREKLFAAISDFRKGCETQEEAEALLQDLLDLPDDLRGELLLDPRARRLLLITFPALIEVFEEIEGNAYQVFLGRMKVLEDRGIVFSGAPLTDEPVEINGTQFDSYIGYKLLDLAEAAVMCAGQINWATGVLQFLSERVLDVDELDDGMLERAGALRDRIQIAVRFDPDMQVADQFDTIKTLTDEAIAELDVWYG
jgi:hypothetical protein